MGSNLLAWTVPARLLLVSIQIGGGGAYVSYTATIMGLHRAVREGLVGPAGPAGWPAARPARPAARPAQHARPACPAAQPGPAQPSSGRAGGPAEGWLTPTREVGLTPRPPQHLRNEKRIRRRRKFCPEVGAPRNRGRPAGGSDPPSTTRRVSGLCSHLRLTLSLACCANPTP